jgi:hypothetical protein
MKIIRIIPLFTIIAFSPRRMFTSFICTFTLMYQIMVGLVFTNYNVVVVKFIANMVDHRMYRQRFADGFFCNKYMLSYISSIISSFVIWFIHIPIPSIINLGRCFPVTFNILPRLSLYPTLRTVIFCVYNGLLPAATPTIAIVYFAHVITAYHNNGGNTIYF